MRVWNSSPQMISDADSVHSDCSYETLLSEGEESYFEEIEVSDSESSYETLIIRPSGKKIVKQQEEIEVSDYVTDSEAEEEARNRRENRTKKKSRANAKTKSAPPAPEKRASAPAVSNRKPSKPSNRSEKSTRKSSSPGNEKNKDDTEEKEDDGQINDPEEDPFQPVERMKYTPKDYYHGFSRDHCNAAKGMKREWKHKSKERMEARKKAMEESADSIASSEKKLKRVVTRVVVVKEVEVEIPAETARQKKEKPLKTIQVRKTRQVMRPKRVKKDKPAKCMPKEEPEEVEHVPVDIIPATEVPTQNDEPTEFMQKEEKEKPAPANIIPDASEHKVQPPKRVKKEKPAKKEEQEKVEHADTIPDVSAHEVQHPKRVKKDKSARKEEQEQVEPVPVDTPVTVVPTPPPKSTPIAVNRIRPNKEPHVVDAETGKKCYMWYARLGQPNKKQFIKKVQKMLDEGTVIGFKVKDVEALPWVAGGMLLSVSKMNKLFLNPEDLSDEE